MAAAVTSEEAIRVATQAVRVGMRAAAVREKEEAEVIGVVATVVLTAAATEPAKKVDLKAAQAA